MLRIALLLVVYTSLVPATASANVPGWLKKCVESTAADIQNAKSAQDLIQKLRGKIHVHTLGARSYGANWKKAVDYGNQDAAVRHYLKQLYAVALDTNRKKGAVGIEKTVTAERVEQQSKVHSSYNTENNTSLPALQVRVRIDAEGIDPSFVSVLVVQDDGCKFGDIAIISGSSEAWFSKQVPSTAAVYKDHRKLN